MKLENIVYNGTSKDVYVFIYDDGSKEVKNNPLSRADKRIVKGFGGAEEVARQTYKYVKDLDMFKKKLDRFIEGSFELETHYAIDSILALSLDKQELMKLKLTIFDNVFVKNSKNREILTNIRKSEDPIDLVMYFGMLRKEANVENKE